MCTKDSKWPQASIEQLRALVKAGKSYGEIADEMGLNRNQVLGAAKRQRDKGDPDFAIREPWNQVFRPKEQRVLKPAHLKLVKKTERPPLPRDLPLFDHYPMPKRENAARTAILPSKSATLLDLSANACRWPTGRLDGQHLFCGNPAAGVYCAGHQQMSYAGAPMTDRAVRRLAEVV